MSRPILIGVAWVASVVLAWFVGSNFAEGKAARSARPAPASSAPTSVEPRDGRPAPAAKPGYAGEVRLRGSQAPDAEPPPVPAPVSDAALDLAEATTVDEASALLMAYAGRKLAQGPEGHKELFRTLDAMLQDKSNERFFKGNDEEQMARLLYPWVKFLVKHDTKVVAMMETLYRTAAEDPAWFEGLDDNAFEMFTEGLALVLPGAVDEETLRRMRSYVETVLARPDDSMPEALEKNRSEMKRNLRWWAAQLTSEEAAAKLSEPGLTPDDLVAVLRGLDPEEAAKLNVVHRLAPAVAAGNREALRLLYRIPLDGGDVATLDQAFIEATALGKFRGWEIRSYQQATNRKSWEEVRPLIESGLRRGQQATQTFAEALTYLAEKPPPDYVGGILNAYDLPEQTRKNLRSRFELR